MMQNKWPSVPGEATHALDAEGEEVEEPITVHTFDEHNWPEFTVTGNGGEVGFVRIACSDCDWVKVFDAPVSFGGLTVATVRHGMSHQEGERR